MSLQKGIYWAGILDVYLFCHANKTCDCVNFCHTSFSFPVKRYTMQYCHPIRPHPPERKTHFIWWKHPGCHFPCLMSFKWGYPCFHWPETATLSDRPSQGVNILYKYRIMFHLQHLLCLSAMYKRWLQGVKSVYEIQLAVFPATVQEAAMRNPVTVIQVQGAQCVRM